MGTDGAQRGPAPCLALHPILFSEFDGQVSIFGTIGCSIRGSRPCGQARACQHPALDAGLRGHGQRHDWTESSSHWLVVSFFLRCWETMLPDDHETKEQNRERRKASDAAALTRQWE